MVSAPAGSDAGGGSTGDADAPQPDQVVLSKVAAGTVAWARSFAGEGGECTAVIENLGSWGARIILLAPARSYGDAVVDSVPAAEEVCRRAGVTVGSWDREAAAKVSVSRADRQKMAGTGR